MKIYKSRIFNLIAGAYLGFPLIYILVAAIWFDIPGSGCIRILFSPFFYLTSAFAIFAGFGLWEMKRWAWYSFLVANFLIGYHNALIAHDLGETHYKLATFLVSLMVIYFIIYRVGKEIRVPYFFPKIRWWESNPRYRLSSPVSLKRNSGETFEGEVLDVSTGGCFIKLRAEIAKDEEIEVQFSIFGYPVQCKGVVVWCTQSTVTHPKGLGIKFNPMSKEQRKGLKQAIRKLKQISVFYRRYRYLLNQDEFLKRLKEIESQVDGG